MRALFCDPGYSESRRQLGALLPSWDFVTSPNDQVRKHLAGVDVVIPYGAHIDAPIMQAGTFGLIQQFGVGLETVDVRAASDAGVWVARAPSASTGNAESVAELAIYLMLALARKSSQLAHALETRVVGEPAGIALAGKSACIIGLGGVGSELGLRLQAFRMRLFGVRERPLLGAPRGVAMRVYGPDRLADALGQSNYVIVCSTMHERNRNLINAPALAAMKKGSFLINIARGGLVDTDALEEALASGHLAGAGLDVVFGEPIPPDHALFKHNVVITPHIAGVTDLSYAGIAKVVAENLTRFAKGEKPHHAVNSPGAVRSRRTAAS